MGRRSCYVHGPWANDSRAIDDGIGYAIVQLRVFLHVGSSGWVGVRSGGRGEGLLGG